MVTQQELTYRQLITLRDGARVLLSPLTTDDRQALIDLFTPVSPEDRRYMRHDVTDPDLVGGWVDRLDYDRVFPWWPWSATAWWATPPCTSWKGRPVIGLKCASSWPRTSAAAAWRRG